jgi:hypothetical protein
MSLSTAALNVAAQLTRLRELKLEQLGTFWDIRGDRRLDRQLQTTALQQLTVLKELRKLQLTSKTTWNVFELSNEVSRWGALCVCIRIRVLPWSQT